MIGLAFGDLLYGAVLTETVFAWPGMGNYVVQSITALDFPAIMGFTVVASTAYVLLNMLVDLHLHGPRPADPRGRLMANTELDGRPAARARAIGEQQRPARLALYAAIASRAARCPCSGSPSSSSCWR